MRTTQQKPGRALCGRGDAAEGSRMRPHTLSWDVGEHPPYCHADAWSAVRLIYILPFIWEACRSRMVTPSVAFSFAEKILRKDQTP